MTVPSIRALAPLTGLSHTALNKHLKAGRFQPEPEGGFDPDKVRVALGLPPSSPGEPAPELLAAGMRIEMWPVDRPIPYPKNARKWSERAIATVAASIREYGFRQPIVVDAAGVIVIGHLRLAAAKSLDLKEVPVHVARDLTPAQIKGLRIADNRTSQEATWDFDLLGPELLDLKAMDFDLSLTGFDTSEVSGLLIKAEPAAGLTEDDAVPEPPVEPATVLGDLWLLGDHRVVCGDCRDFGAVARLLDGKKANVVITSPPYAEQRDYDPSSGFRPIPPDEYVAWFRDLAVNIRAVLADDGSYFLNIKPSCDGVDTDLYVLDLVLAHAREWGFHFATEFCWERNGVPKSVTQRFKNQFEPVYQFALNRWKMRPDAVRHESQSVPTAGTGAESVPQSFGAAKKRRNGTSQMISDIQGTTKDAGEYIGPGLAYPGNRLPTFAGTHEAHGHAAAFPVGLPEFFIRAYTDEGDSALDPFMGSGSSLIACEKQRRIGHGMEISPNYVDVIVTRWQAFTGKSATLDGDGRTFDELKAARTVSQAAA